MRRGLAQRGNRAGLDALDTASLDGFETFGQMLRASISGLVPCPFWAISTKATLNDFRRGRWAYQFHMFVTF